MEFDILKNGDLKITLDTYSYDWLEIEKKNNNHDEVDIMNKLMDQFGQLGDGYGIYNGDELGMLSNAPIILCDYFINDTENGSEIDWDEDSQAWYYPDYQIKDFTDILYERGEIVLPKLEIK